MKHRNTKRGNTKHRNTKRGNTKRRNTKRINTKRRNTKRINTKRRNTKRRNTKRRNTKRRNTMRGGSSAYDWTSKRIEKEKKGIKERTDLGLPAKASNEQLVERKRRRALKLPDHATDEQCTEAERRDALQIPRGATDEECDSMEEVEEEIKQSIKNLAKAKTAKGIAKKKFKRIKKIHEFSVDVDNAEKVKVLREREVTAAENKYELLKSMRRNRARDIRERLRLADEQLRLADDKYYTASTVSGGAPEVGVADVSVEVDASGEIDASVGVVA